MARRRGAPGGDPLKDLATKLEILEQEMAVQQAALDRLKAMGPVDDEPRSPDPPTLRHR